MCLKMKTKSGLFLSIIFPSSRQCILSSSGLLYCHEKCHQVMCIYSLGLEVKVKHDKKMEKKKSKYTMIVSVKKNRNEPQLMQYDSTVGTALQ